MKLTVQKYFFFNPSVSTVHAWSFRVPVIHRTLSWPTTGSLTCECNHWILCVRIYIYKRGLGTPTANQHNIFDSEKLSPNCSCAPDWVRTRVTDVIEFLKSDALPVEPPRHPGIHHEFTCSIPAPPLPLSPPPPCGNGVVEYYYYIMHSTVSPSVLWRCC